MYPKYTFHRTNLNSWKSKDISRRQSLDQDLPIFSRVGWPNLLHEVLLQKVKDITIGTRLAGCVINRRQVVCIGRGVVMANDPNLLLEVGVDHDFTEGWARSVVKVSGLKGREQQGKWNRQPSP